MKKRAERRSRSHGSHGFPKLTKRFSLGIYLASRLFSSLVVDTVATPLRPLGLCADTDRRARNVADFGEPAPEAVGPMKAVLGKVQMHKLILLGGPEIDELRPEAEAHFAGRAALTTAIGGMLEASSLTVALSFGGVRVRGVRADGHPR